PTRRTGTRSGGRVFFYKTQHLAGLMDLNNACSGWMLYDLAITLNDWCSNTDGSLDGARARALLGAYANRRAFTGLEA
ncbi:phosphotransferase, partial [Pseudomonas aeruginosa]|uniref:phosphotransferase n=1 Tax=Pseudomonas aeruginosa TaxID=287 RepID=UPI003CC65D0B